MSAMRTAIVVQARMGSSRLPGKVMMAMGARTVLEEVLERCRAIPGADIVVCATPDEPASAPIQALARAAGAMVVAGSEHDVLARYALAAREAGADIVMRVTSDCPLIDPEICGAVLALRAREDADYAANNLVRSFPHGLDCEAFTAAALRRAEAEASDPYAREHVTPWLRTSPGLRRVNLAASDARWLDARWTLDYPEDLEFMRAVAARLPEGRARMASEAVHRILAAHPDIGEINACRKTKSAAPTERNPNG
jgi:spore coat polysaccharide biosynthesis protein SpsF